MGKVEVFLDTDVVIAAILSKTGASSEAINNSTVTASISKSVSEEVKEIGERIRIERATVTAILSKLHSKFLKLGKTGIINKYGIYVLDVEDSHVVAGAHSSQSKFLLTHNTKHYRIDKIKADLNIMVLKPGLFLQYLRNFGKFS